MATDFVQRQINRLLEQAGEAIVQLDWRVVNQRAQAVLALDPENADGLALLAGGYSASSRSFPATGEAATGKSRLVGGHDGE